MTIRGISRKGNVVNLSGEKISTAHVTTAITAACIKTGAEVMDYTVYGTVENGIGHYEIMAMFNNVDVDAEEFLAAFEGAMKSINNEFKVVRETGALGPTVLKVVENSIYDRIVKKSHCQSKPVPLAADPNFLDFLEL